MNFDLISILLIISGVFAIVALPLLIYLIASHKRSRKISKVLKQDTELITSFTATVTSNLSRKIEADDITEIMQNAQGESKNTEFPALEGRYIIKEELHDSKSSRVFLAQSVKLGNLWIIKHIPKGCGQLANEENILKLLNHISLPKIIDILHDEKGTYLIEGYIEGCSLDKLFEAWQKINQSIVVDWAEQIAQVLNYLHNIEPTPVFHLDIKPSNFMVTHDNKLVLIDFGIAKRFGQDEMSTNGLTYKYAAPEQFKHNVRQEDLTLIASRFGVLPQDWLSWELDARTDIYSLGVMLFELVMGEGPTFKIIGDLKNRVSADLYKVIKKCLAIDPGERYQSAGDLLFDIQRIKVSKIKMAKALFMRKAAALAAALSIVFSGSSFAGSAYINAVDTTVRPEIVIISMGESTDLSLEKQLPGGRIIALDNSRVNWTIPDDNIARIDGNRINGINEGETELKGIYRNKPIKLSVRVVEPLDGTVEISQRYQAGYMVQPFAGTLEREHRDGRLSGAEFVSPESIARAEDGTIYIADSGILRKIKNDRVETIILEPNYLTPKIVRCYQNEVFVLTHEWEDDDGAYYNIIRLGEGEAESLYLADGYYTAVEDFDISPGGLIYFLDRNIAVDKLFLRTLTISDSASKNTICELPEGISALTLDDNGAVYLADQKAGVIQVWQEGRLSYFAGIGGEKAFIDGAAPLFYMPQKIKWADDALYVWDFNVLRRITVKAGVALECITLAGEASPTFVPELIREPQRAEDIILPNSMLTEFVVFEDNILITDPKHGVIWQY
ncbi:MAG: protein kinase [Clostridiales bacterium]|jgi:serine/threonine protein kinase|nr:protein kinase [Clostridiales bacterium]